MNLPKWLRKQTLQDKLRVALLEAQKSLLEAEDHLESALFHKARLEAKVARLSSRLRDHEVRHLERAG